MWERRLRFGYSHIRMAASDRTSERWAGLVGVSANRKHEVERLSEVAIYRFGILPADVDSSLGHRANGSGMDAFGRLRSSRIHFQFLWMQMAEEPSAI
jgi:hypothetical protein